MKKRLLFLLPVFFFVPLAAQEKEALLQPEAVVQRQLEAYNARDIDAFMATYSDSIKVYNSQGILTTKGHDALRVRYAGFFEATPNLYCLIENRIVINNKVIDKEKVTAGKRIIHAVAIYDVNDGKITKVRFID